ncbi:MAG: hypothetical protein ABSG28_08995 [Methanoregula sp.]|uniref:hypothetical protein n=1 Tax=Methanoregula sp. TaxID=2052170 RepID=UPI003C2A5533
MTFPATLSRTERVLLCLALVVVIVFGIRMAGSVITIVLVALVLTLLLYPATKWLREKKGVADFHQREPERPEK